MYATVYSLGTLTNETIDETRVDIRLAETLLSYVAQYGTSEGTVRETRIDDSDRDRKLVPFLLNNLTRENQVITLGTRAYVVPFRAFNPYHHA